MNEIEKIIDLNTLNLTEKEKKMLIKIKEAIPVGIAS
jgi:hypothetical protein